MCPYICAVHSCLVYIQPEVRLTGPGGVVLGARGVLTIPFPPAGAAQVSIVRVGIAVRQVVEGSRQVGRDVDDVESSVVSIA
jgi:hypothetical protein